MLTNKQIVLYERTIGGFGGGVVEELFCLVPLSIVYHDGVDEGDGMGERDGYHR